MARSAFIQQRALGIVPAMRRCVQLTQGLVTGQVHRGYCSVCDVPTFFTKEETDREGTFSCWKCGSHPRARALLRVLEEVIPNWRDLSLHEPSPGGPLSEKLFVECPRYLPSSPMEGRVRGDVVEGVRCEDLFAQTFPANRFDLVITVDVLDRVSLPRDSLVEIARTLKPGGMHVFTLPWNPEQPTVTRARRDGRDIFHLEKPRQVPGKGGSADSLVYTDWGSELPYWVLLWSGLVTTVHRIRDRRLGLYTNDTDVFVSRKVVSDRQ